MICNFEKHPNYINTLDTTPKVKTALTTLHYNVVRDLYNIKYNGKSPITEKTGSKGTTFLILTKSKSDHKNKFIQSELSKINEKYGFDVIGVKPIEINEKLYNAIGVDVSKLLNKTFNEVTSQESNQTLLDDIIRAGLELQDDIQDVYFNKNGFQEYTQNVEYKKLLQNFFNSIGVTLEEDSPMLAKYGVNGVANITKKIIGFTKGFEHVLPEEAAHFLVEFLPKDNFLLQDMLSKIDSYKIYQDLLKNTKYTEDENYLDKNGNLDILKLKKEAIGKVIAEHIKSITSNTPLTLEVNEPESKGWLKQIILFIKSLFQKDSFNKAANKILSNNISDIDSSMTELKADWDNIYFSRKDDYQSVKNDFERNQNKDEILQNLKNAIQTVNDFKNNVRNRKIDEYHKQKAIDTLRHLSDKLTTLGKTEDASEYAESLAKSYVDLVSDIEGLYKELLKRYNVLFQIPQEQKGIIIGELDDVLKQNILLNRFIDDITSVSVLLDSKSPIKQMVSNILSYKQEADIAYKKAALNTINEILNDTYAPKYKELLDNFNKEYKFLQDIIDNPNSTKKQVDAAIKRLKKEKETFDKISPSQENIIKELSGNIPDISMTKAYLNSSIHAGNYLIAGLSEILDDKMHSLNINLVNFANDITAVHDKFFKESGANINDDEETYKPFMEVLKKPIKINEKGEIVYSERQYLLRPYNIQYVLDLETIALQRRHIKKQLQTVLEPKAHAELIEKLRDLNKQEKDIYKDLEQEYTDEYYAKTDAILDEVLKDGDNTFTAREATKDIWANIFEIEKELETETSSANIELLLERREELKHKLQEAESLYGKTEGTKEYTLAKQLIKYKESAKEVRSYKLTDKSRDNFKIAKEFKDKQLEAGDISQEQYNAWLETNTMQDMITDAYKEKRASILNELAEIGELYLKNNKEVSEKIKKSYKDIEDIAKKYRTDDNVINGILSKEDEQKAILELEKVISTLNNQMESLTGLSSEDIHKIGELRQIIKTTKDSDIKNESERELNELISKQKNKKVPKVIVEKYARLKRELGELSTSENTEYYNQKLADEVNKLASEMEDLPLDKVVVINKFTYTKKENGNWVNEIGNEISESELQRLLKIEKSLEKVKDTDWYKNNHIRTFVWKKNENFDSKASISDTNKPGFYVEEDKPIYIWRISKPTDENYIEKNVPAFKYWEKIVKPEYINPKFADKNDPYYFGYPLPKEGKFVNEKYNQLKSDKVRFEYLKNLTRLYFKGQNTVHPFARPGYELPVEERETFNSMKDTFSKQGIKNLVEQGKRAFEKTEQDKDISFGDYDNNLSDEDFVLRGVPHTFSRDLDIKLQSKDIAKLIAAYYKRQIERHILTEIKPTFNVALQLTGQTPLRMKTPGLITKILKTGDQSNIHAKLKDFGESMFFNRNIKPLSINIFGKEYSVDKAISNLMSAANLSLLGFKPIAATKNNISGKFQNILLATKYPDIVTRQNLTSAQAYVTAHTDDILKDAFKTGNKSFIGQLADIFDFRQGHFKDEFGRNIDASLLRTASNLTGYGMGFKNSLETEHQFVQGIAILKSHYLDRVVDGVSSKISILDAYELRNGLISLKPGVIEDKKQIQKVRKLIKEENSISNGNFNKIDRAMMDKYSIYKAAISMSKFIGPGIRQRYWGKYYNPQTNKIEEGFYTTAVPALIRELKLHGLGVFQNNTLSEKEKKAATTLAIEVGTVVALIGLSWLAGSSDPDRHKKLKDHTAENYIKAQYLNFLLSLNNEIQSLSVPAGLDNMVQKFKSPFPSLSIVKLLERMFVDGVTGATYQHATGLWDKGDSKFIAELIRLIGVEALVLDTINPQERLKRTEAGQILRN